MKDWRHEALCRKEEPELFFPIGDTGPALAQIDQAKRVCQRCPVTEECLHWALESGQDAGIWGGMSEDERRELKRRHAPQPTPTQRSPEKPPRRKSLKGSLSAEEREELSLN